MTLEQFTIGNFHFIQYQTFLVLWDMFIWKIEMSRCYCEHHREAVTYLLCGFSPWLPCILVRALLQSVLWRAHWSSLSACCDLLQKKSVRESLKKNNFSKSIISIYKILCVLYLCHFLWVVNMSSKRWKLISFRKEFEQIIDL